MLEALVMGAGWFLTFLVIHILWFHYTYVQNCFTLIMKILIGCVLGYVSTILALGPGGRQADEVFIQVAYGLLLMGCLFILYMPFYYTIVASLSVQTLICIEESAGRALSIGELRRRFASTEIVEGRLQIMVGNGYLTEEAGKYRVTPKACLIANLFSYLKRIWKLGPGG